MNATGSLMERFERDGFVLVENVLSRDECTALKAAGKEVLREHARPGATVFVGAAAASGVFFDLASDDRLVQALHELMPTGVMFMSDKLVFKSGVQTKPTPWHCDEAYWRGTRPKLSAWIALDDVSASNGALRVLPGGHHEKWTHTAPGGQGEEFDLRIRDLDGREGETIVCEMTLEVRCSSPIASRTRPRRTPTARTGTRSSARTTSRRPTRTSTSASPPGT